MFNSDYKYIYTPKYFLKQNISNLRQKKENSKFRDDVLPLIRQELIYAHKLKDLNTEPDLNLFFNPRKHLNTQTQESYCKSFLNYLSSDIEQSSL